MAGNYDGSIRIGVEVDDSKAQRDLDELQDNVESFEGGFKKAGDGATGFADVLRGNLLSNAIVSGIQGLAGTIKGLATDFIESAASVKAETSQFEQTFGALQGAASEAIGNVADVSGILETRLNTLGSQIYAFARSSGGDTTESLNLMEAALQAAADSAAYYDRSIEDSAATLQSFLKGNYENDAALGLSATEATRNAAAMDLFGQKFSDLTEIQKQQTLLQMVLDAQALSGAMGQAAREADGWENVQGNLNESWRQFMASAGTPLLESLVPIIQQITAGLQEWTNSIDWAAFSETIKGFVSAIVENGPTILSVIAGIGAGFVAWNVVTMIQGVVTAISAFRAANDGLKLSQIALNAVMNANPLAIIVTLIAGVVAALITLWNTNEDFRNAVKKIWEDIKTFFVNAWEAIKVAWQPAIEFFKLIWDSIKGIFSAVKAVLSGDFQGAWDAIKGIAGKWADYFKGVWNNIKNVFSNAWSAFRDIGKNIVEGIKQGISNAWSSFKDWIGGLFDGVVGGVKNLLGIHSPSKVFAQIGDYMMQGLAKGVDDGSGFAMKAVKNATYAITRVANASLSPIKMPRVLVPGLASGSVVPPNRKFLAVLGDNKTETEVVSPLSTMKQAVMEAMRESGTGNKQTTIVLTGEMAALARVLRPYIEDEGHRVGVSIVTK